MTTILGMRNEKGGEHAILGSDLSSTSSAWKSNGEQAYLERTKQDTQKIYVDPEQNFALGMSGVFDQPYVDFLHGLLEHKIDLKAALEKEFFEELLKLNLSRADYRVVNTDAISVLLFTTRFDGKPKIYKCWPMGKIENLPVAAIGSGSQYALNYLGSQMPSIPPHLALPEAIDLTVKSLDEASRDIYTSGLDMVIVTPKEIKAYGNLIKEDMEKAKADSITKIKQSLG